MFSWCELRKCTEDLTLRYERKLYLLADTPDNQRLVGKYLEFFQFPDGRVEIRVAGQSIPYFNYNKRDHIDAAVVADNRRLGHLLEVVKQAQSKRDNRVVRATAPRTERMAFTCLEPRSRIRNDSASCRWTN